MARLYAMNCQINGVTYKNRIYPSSPAIGPITYHPDRSEGVCYLANYGLTATTLPESRDANRYLRQGDREAKKVAGLTVISVDKKNKRF
jgi:hypothetical protein